MSCLSLVELEKATETLATAHAASARSASRYSVSRQISTLCLVHAKAY